MRVFVTGASGSIGSAVLPELLGAGHEVLGLARSATSAAALHAAGAEVLAGSLADRAVLAAGAEACDAVVHLAYDPVAAAPAAEWRAVEVLGSALEDTGKPLAVASTVLGLTPGWVATERDGIDVDPSWSSSPRAAAALATLGFAERGVRTSLVRLAPSVHDRTPTGLVGALVELARERGVSGHPGKGGQRWPSVHRRDVARLFRLAVEGAPAGSVLHGTAEEGVSLREIAEAIGAAEGLPVVAVPADATAAHFGRLAPLVRTDAPASSALTQRLLGWRPTGPGLLDDVRHWSPDRVGA